jgi:hypothetical protein
MISRTYVVQMPEGSEFGNTLDILVRDDPGAPDAPVLGGANASSGAYYEWRGRPLRFETIAADGASGGFVPRLALGFSLSIVPVDDTSEAITIPSVQLSESLVGTLASTDTGPTINIPSFADPNDLPAIQLVNSETSAGLFFLVSLQVMEQKDEDRNAAGV